MGDTSVETSPPMEEQKEIRYCHFFTKPMFEVFHISIDTKEINLPGPDPFLDGNPCQIHGTVRVVNEDGKVFEFYNRKESDSETLIPGDKISLCAFPINPYKLLKVVVMLYDLAHNVEIANGYFLLDYCKAYEYDRVESKRVQGEYGFASVCFSTFQHAVIASVEKVVLHNNAAESSLGDNLLFGKVLARLERKSRKTDGNIDDEFPSVTLFQNQQNTEEVTREQAKFDTPIKLFRSCVVVPFYCSLTIEAEFDDKTDTRIDMAIKLNVHPITLNKESVQKQNCEMHVKVDWLDCYRHFPLEGKVCDSPRMEKKNPRCQPHVSVPMAPSFSEVFTLLICAPNDDDLVLRGTVDIVHCMGSFCIFNGEEKCHGQKSLQIGGPHRAFETDYFGIKVRMNDEKGRVVSRGFFIWDVFFDCAFLRDQRICSVIVGDIGYAAVHYSMFEYSLKATTRVSFLSKTIPQAFVKVSGSIKAEYGNCEYSTLYDQQYYKSTLFSRDDHVRVGLISGSTLPLLKPVIPVPVDNPLILDVNLSVMGPYTVDKQDQDQEIAVINKLVEFKFNVDGYFIYKGADYIISVCVEWSVDSSKEITRPILPHKTWLHKVLQKASTTA